MARPTLVVVSGAAGTGKTRLAHALADAIGCPAICRDEIKEGMVHARRLPFKAAPGDELTQRTFPLFFDVLRVLLEGGVSVVAEAAFQDWNWRKGLEPLLPLATLRLVHCHIADGVAVRRRSERAGVPTRVAHADADPGVPLPSAFQRYTTDAPTLIVDTTDGYKPAFAEVVAFVRG